MASINNCVTTALIIAGSFIGQSHSQQQETQEITMTFEEYVVKYEKFYPSSADKHTHQEMYVQNVQNINKHNLQTPLSYTKGINQFTDRTTKELNEMKGLDRNLHRQQMNQRAPQLSASLTLADIQDLDLPERVDWREKNVITPVKNQGQCGSCWTFASAETIESHWAIKTGRLQDLSEQFILDCTPNTNQCGGSGGCGGGTAELAYARLKTLGGIPSEWEYPYLSVLGKASKCHGLPLTREQPHSGAVASAANVTGFHATETNSYASLISNLALQGPMAVSVDAGAWHDYSGGIFDGGNHTNPDLDHLVQLVGYGTDNGNDYWLIRNSWTPNWGENGYIRLKRVDPSKIKGGASCGLDITPLDGNGCKDGPPTVKVCGQSGILYDGVYPFV
jgi:cathepsin L